MARATILQVEDDSNDVLLMEHACRQAGVPVDLQAVGDADQALAYLRGVGHFANREQFPLPQLILLDLRLPRRSGLEVLEWMRRNERFRRLPVVVLSSSTHGMDLQRSYDLGANSYLVKPVGFEPLVEVVKALYHYWVELNQQPEPARAEPSPA